MYICRSEDQPNITQMELSDYFLKQRKIIFNMEDPADVRKAQRVLKPKGMTKRRRRNTQSKPLKTKQQVIDFKPQGVSLTVLNPEPERISPPEFPFIDIIQLNKSSTIVTITDSKSHDAAEQLEIGDGGEKLDVFNEEVVKTDEKTKPIHIEQPSEVDEDEYIAKTVNAAFEEPTEEKNEGIKQGQVKIKSAVKTPPVSKSSSKKNKITSGKEIKSQKGAKSSRASLKGEKSAKKDIELKNQIPESGKEEIPAPVKQSVKPLLDPEIPQPKNEKKREAQSSSSELSPEKSRLQNHSKEKFKREKDEINTSVGAALKTRMANEQSLPKELSVIQPTEPKKLVSPERIALFGMGGSIEVDCPFCGDSVSFYPIDIDGRKMTNTRLCSCDAIVRLSIREFHYKIFQDLEIPMETIKKRVKRRENPVFDENGSPIYSYALENQP